MYRQGRAWSRTATCSARFSGLPARSSSPRQSIHRLRFGTVWRQCPRLARLWWHGQALEAAEFSPDRRRLVTLAGDRSAQLWDVATGRKVASLDHTSTVKNAAFSADSRRLVTAGMDRTARLWDAVTGRPLASPLPHTAGVLLARFSPNGRWVATADGDDGV